MSVPALGEAATHLPWLSPGAAALVALARTPVAAAWSVARTDPGAVLLVVRQSSAALTVPSLAFFPALLHDPAVLEGALRHLDQNEASFVDWSQPAVQPIYRAALSYARLACHLAERTAMGDPAKAWVAGLLAPLGWLAVCATDSSQAAACLADPGFAQQPAATQQRYWNFEQATIARRLARRWQLPPWLAVVAGHLGLPAATAQALGADRELFHLVQLAIGLAQRQGRGLHLTVGLNPAEAVAALGLPASELPGLEREAAELEHDPIAEKAWTCPAGQPLLRDLLCLAVENRRLRDAPLLARLEGQVDDLHCALEDQHLGEAERLQARKLSALAEFAAGAGHEINNPLAVISGQAQYLLSQLRKVEAPNGTAAEAGSPVMTPCPSSFVLPAERALETIIGQTKRIHQILNEVMQFARPPRSQRQPVDLPGLMREVVNSLTDLAIQRRVRLDFPEPPPLTLYADPRHVRTALTCLLRNAVEAAPAEGWAGIRLETPAPDQVEIVVEDSGNGPAASLREHLFDPFYSGRTAGRGRGLGLPTAWRLAREQGGNVRFADLPDGPTRFVLSLPCGNGTNGKARSEGPDLAIAN